MVAVIVSCSILERTDVERSLLNEVQNHKGWLAIAKLKPLSLFISLNIISTAGALVVVAV